MKELRIVLRKRPGRNVSLVSRWGAIAIFCLAVPAAALAQDPRENLVNAAYWFRTDDLGFQWSIQEGGVLQNSGPLIQQANRLDVNGQPFQCQGAQMSADGTEYVFSGQAGELQVTRRVLFDAKRGAARYLEILTNPTRADVQASVTLFTQLNPQLLPQNACTDSSAKVTGLLPESDSGIFVPTQSPDARPGLLMVLASPGAKSRPLVQPGNRSEFRVIYPITLAAGQTAALLHVIAQRDRKLLAAASAVKSEFYPLLAYPWQRDCPADLRGVLVNIASDVGFGRDSLDLAASLSELGLERGSDDVLGLGPDMKIRGSATCSSLRVETAFGSRTCPLENVAAIQGHKGGRERGTVYLRDGQILVGRVQADGLRFETPLGATLALNAASLDRLLLRAKPDDFTPPPATQFYLTCRDGSRLALAAAEQAFHLLTAWGDLTIKPGDMLRLAESVDPELGIGHRVQSKDGSRLFGYLRDAKIQGKSLLFGSIAIGRSEMISLTAVASSPRSAPTEAKDDPASPCLYLSGDMRLVGSVTPEEFQFQADGNAFSLACAQCRRLRAIPSDDSGPPAFRAELWDGSILLGRLSVPMLTLKTLAGDLRIPTGDIAALQTPAAQVPASLRERAAALIGKLGAEDWNVREQATAELISLGAAVRDQIEAAARQAVDPEVEHRLKVILGEFPRAENSR